ncbi:MAG TPA: nuclease-related domain-containing protein [Opitutales bacterium]|nr:nuclease-related domain-containing protein [Opitutales bacterium]
MRDAEVYLMQHELMKNIIMEIMPGIYFIFVIWAVVLVFKWWMAARKRRLLEKFPLPDDFKVMRLPGESQQREVEKLYEDFPAKVLMGSVLSLALPLLVLEAAIQFHADHNGQRWALIIAGALFGLETIALIAWACSLMFEIRNRRLGVFGERVVGEMLDGLKLEGYQVFHDVPTGDAKHPYNVDHVVVGETGIFAVETKAYRKKKGRRGLKPHVITFADDRLIFPWADSKEELAQAKEKAQWLSRQLSLACQSSVEAKPILVFPGWYIEPEGAWTMTLNHKRVNEYIRRQRGACPTKGELRTTTAYLKDRCTCTGRGDL